MSFEFITELINCPCIYYVHLAFTQTKKWLLQSNLIPGPTYQSTYHLQYRKSETESLGASMMS